MPVKYYVIVGGARQGPFTRAELEGQGVRRETLIWYKGLPDWVPADQVAELLGVFDEPPAVPGAARASAPAADRPRAADRPAEPPEERPALAERDVVVHPDQIKGPGVNRPRAEMPAPAYRDDPDDMPPPITRMHVPYDIVGMRRLYLGGMYTFVPGVVLALAFGVSVAFLGIHGIEGHVPRFDPQRNQIVNVFDPGARTAETLAAVSTVAMAVFAVICLASGAACFFVLLYRAWRVIQDGRTYPPPGRAVGLLFVPFFNVYWVFVGIWGLARNLNRFVRRYDLEAPTASQPLGFAISLYSALTFIPFPFAGLVPLGLNLLLWPLFMRSVYRTVAAICDGGNQARIAHAPLERMLRHADLRRPVSAHILSIVAIALAPLGVGLFAAGFGTELNALRHYNRDVRQLQVHQQAIDQMRAQNQDQNRIRAFENQANVLEHTISFRWRQHLIINAMVLGGGVVVLAIAIALAFVSRMCARTTEEAALQLSPA